MNTEWLICIKVSKFLYFARSGDIKIENLEKITDLSI